MKTLRIGLIGLGTVGQGLAKLLKTRRAFIKNRFNVDFIIDTICDLKVDHKFIKSLGKVTVTKNYHEILNNPKIDVVVELIGGYHPAAEIIRGALERGKHVVTANKAVISTYGKDLFDLAKHQNRSIYFESAVLAGVPIIKTLAEGMAGNKYNNIFGIVNGTCNYILDEMETNQLGFWDAVKKAQDKGYAEADPTLDINGMDTAHKLAILTFLGMGKRISVRDIHTEGIKHVALEDLVYADEMGLTIKLLAIAKKDGKTLEARVHPTLIPKDHSLATVRGVNNAVLLGADVLGDVLLVGAGAGAEAAASGVFSDLINLATYCEDGDRTWNGAMPDGFESLTLRPVNDVVSEYYLRLSVLDQPGVLSKITGILGKNKVSIASVKQKEVGQKKPVPLVMLTHEAKESNMDKALHQITKMKEVKAKPVAIRMERF